MRFVVLLITVCSLICRSQAFPSGVPATACASMLPEGHIPLRAEEVQLNFTLETDRTLFEPGAEVLVRLRGPGTYRGIFLQVRDSPALNTTATAVGSWQRSAFPNIFRVVACPGGPNSALSHASRTDKQGDTDFVWVAPDDCETGAEFTLRATVLEEFQRFQSGLSVTLVCINLPPIPPEPITLEPPIETPPSPTTTTQSPPPPTTQPPPPTTTTQPPPPPTTTTQPPPPPPPTTTQPPLPPPATTQPSTPLPTATTQPPPPTATTQPPPPTTTTQPPPPITTTQPPPPPPTTTTQPPPPITTTQPPPPPPTTTTQPPPPITTTQPPPPPPTITTTQPPPPPPTTTTQPPPPITTTQPPPPLPTTTTQPPPLPTTTTQPPPPPPTATTQPPPLPPTTTQPPPPPPITTTQPLFIGPTQVAGCQFFDLNSIPAEYNTGFENEDNPYGGWEAMGQRFGYKWLRQRGPTLSFATGPSNANQGDYYIYTEASQPARPGDQAILRTRQDIRGCFCFRFASSHEVFEGNRLAVEVGGVTLFEESSPDTVDWRNREVQVDTPAFVRIRIIATRGPNWLGDLGLDNIQLTPGRC